MRTRPPRLAERLLIYFLREELAEEVLGDLEENFDQRLERRSVFRAKVNYWYQVLHYLRPFAMKRLIHIEYGPQINYAMLINYWNVARRFFKKHLALTTMNVVVFGVGLAACILILSKVTYEWSYDTFYPDHEDIYRVSLDHYYPYDVYQNSTAQSFYPMGSELKNRYPEVEAFARVSGKLRNTIIRVGEKSVQEDHFHLINPSFFDVFTVQLLYGDTTDLGAYDVFLSESLAIKLFGQSDVIGASVDIWDGSIYQVKGVYADLPDNTHFKYNMLLTLVRNENRMSNWEHYSVHTYLRLQKGVDVASLEEKLDVFNTEFSKLSDEQSVGVDYRWEIALQPLSSIYLTSDLLFEHRVNGDLQGANMLAVMAFLIIVISCFNHINLTNSVYATRLKEYYVRKAQGAHKSDLLKQYAFESLLLLLFGVIAAAAFLYVLPYVSRYSVSFVDRSTLFYVGVAAVLLIAFMIAVVLSSSAFAFINPMKFVNGQFVANPVMKRVGKSLIVVQFLISFLLLAGALTVSRQLDYLTDHNPGISISDVVTVEFPGLYYPNHSEELERFKMELEQQTGIQSVSYTGSAPGTPYGMDGSIRFVEDKTENAKFNYLHYVSAEYFDTYDLELLAGRVFDERSPADSAAIVVNETTAIKLGVTDYQRLIGQKVVMPRYGEWPTFEIVGVSKDYYHESLKKEVEPVAYLSMATTGYCTSMSIRLADAPDRGRLTMIEETFASSFSYLYNLGFVTENYTGFLSSYYELSKLIRALSLLAILMAGVGLFGLASNETEKRSKEVAIRKVNGARAEDICLQFIIYFAKILGLAFLLSVPVSVYFANEWLSNFAVRIEVGAWFFILQLLITSVLVIISIGYSLAKMSMQNPIVALKNND